MYGPFVLIIGKMFKDVVKVVGFFICILGGFSSALLAVSTQLLPGDGLHTEYSLKNIVLVLIRAAFDEMDSENDFLDSTLYPISLPLYLSYETLVVIVLLNLLIAMMTSTYAGVVEKTELEWQWQFARLVLRLEATWAGTLLKPRQVHRMHQTLHHDATGHHASCRLQVHRMLGAEDDFRIEDHTALGYYRAGMPKIMRRQPALRPTDNASRKTGGDTGSGALSARKMSARTTGGSVLSRASKGGERTTRGHLGLWRRATPRTPRAGNQSGSFGKTLSDKVDFAC